jgi:hypothetical protein
MIVDVDFSFSELYKITLRMSFYAVRYMIWVVAGCGVLSLVSYVLTLSTNISSSSLAAIWYWSLIIFVSGTPTLLLLLPIVSFIRARAIYRTANLDMKRRYTFSEEGVAVKTSQSSGEAKWSAISLVRETRKYFFLYSVPGFANVIPKKCFANEAYEETLRTLARNQVRNVKLRG